MQIEDLLGIYKKCINSYLNPIDFYESIIKMNDKIDVLEEGKLLLTINDVKLMPILENINYITFLKKVIQCLEINVEILPVFLSQIDKETLLIMSKLLQEQKDKVEVMIDTSNSTIVIRSSIFMTDVMYGPIAEIHSKSLRTIHMDLEYLKLGAETFPNPKGNSTVDNLVEEWCYEKIFGAKKIMRGILVC